MCYLVLFQAVMLDSTDVNMWYKIGQVALRLVRIPLARHAFEEGLHCNPDHWPCMDNLITVLYTLSDYTCVSSVIIGTGSAAQAPRVTVFLFSRLFVLHR